MKLQQIDSQLDEIKKIRGDLPDEVQDLEDEIAGYDTRVGKFVGEFEEIEQNITNKRNTIQEAKKLILRYEQQQLNVRNNREYDAITKEMELQDLEIQICNKKIRELEEQLESKQLQIDETKRVLEGRSQDLEDKKKELDVIISETEVEEQKFEKRRERAVKDIDKRLLNSYNRIRKNARNGLAVVSVKRLACGGCFNMVPPQRQVEIGEKKKIIVCEHCGRILADVIEFIEEPRKKTKRKTTRKSSRKTAAKKTDPK